MGQQQLTGPDLSLGIPSESLRDGGMVTGHVGGEAVVVARRGRDLFAIGATCTHYGGPLGEGLLVEETVRCPWHHACFSLRTGEPLRSPALLPVSLWRVEDRGGSIFVGEKIERPGSLPSPEQPETVIIVGAGAAGAAVADTLRREGYDGRVVMVTRESSPPYDKPNLSKDFLAGNAPEEWIPLHPREYYDQRRIDLRLGVTVTRIDPRSRSLSLSTGERIPFDKLVLAMGADVRRLNIPGSDSSHVLYLRTFADSRAIIDRISSGKRAVVIGSSFIGLEVAASLRTRGVDVTVVAPEEVPLQRVMGSEVGGFIRRVHEERGVRFRLQRNVTAITSTFVRLDDGEELPADLVVVGIGVVPAANLAAEAGLHVENGIVVDEYLQTSVPAIFAAGDLARWPDPYSNQRIRVEHWVVAGRQGQTVARNILGRRERFDAVPFFWSQHYDLVIAYVGHAPRWDRIDINGSLESHDATIAFHANGRVAAVATLFRDRISLEAERAMERRDLSRLGEIIASAG